MDSNRAEIQRALEKIDVADFLDRESCDYSESYGTRGLQLNLTECPACKEGGRKTYINAETGLGNCFHGSCGMKFNKWKLVKAVSGLAGPALEAHIFAVAEDAGWMPKRARREIVRAALELPSKLHALPVGDQNLQYLQDRKITCDTARWFDLSYCHQGWWKYTTSEGEERFVSYDQRVIIPIADLEGQLVSFQGRDVTGERDPKYLFPTGFAVAGSHLYNAHNFVNEETTHVVVGEGAFDCWAIHQAMHGLPEFTAMLPIATFGMHLSAGPDGQIAKLSALQGRGLKTITFMWDAEQKALAFAVKAGLALRALGFNVRIALLPAGKDPNEVSAEVVRQAIFKAVLLDKMSAIRLMMGARALA